WRSGEAAAASASAGTGIRAASPIAYCPRSDERDGQRLSAGRMVTGPEALPPPRYPLQHKRSAEDQKRQRGQEAQEQNAPCEVFGTELLTRFRTLDGANLKAGVRVASVPARYDDVFVVHKGPALS